MPELTATSEGVCKHHEAMEMVLKGKPDTKWTVGIIISLIMLAGLFAGIILQGHAAAIALTTKTVDTNGNRITALETMMSEQKNSNALVLNELREIRNDLKQKK